MIKIKAFLVFSILCFCGCIKYKYIVAEKIVQTNYISKERNKTLFVVEETNGGSLFIMNSKIFKALIPLTDSATNISLTELDKVNMKLKSFFCQKKDKKYAYVCENWHSYDKQYWGYEDLTTNAKYIYIVFITSYCSDCTDNLLKKGIRMEIMMGSFHKNYKNYFTIKYDFVKDNLYDLKYFEE